MNYIYDIVLNFNREYYNFFEWDKKDTIVNIKKIPLFKVEDKLFNIFKYYNVNVDNSFTNMIKDKTSTYSKLKLEYAAIICNGKEAIAILLNKNGVLIKRSSLLLDEEEEVLDECYDFEVVNIQINKYSKKKISNVIRYKREKKEWLLKYINKENSLTNLKYIYYDYYEKEENDISIIKNDLIKEINNNWNNKLDKLYNTVKMFKKTTQ